MEENLWVETEHHLGTSAVAAKNRWKSSVFFKVGILRHQNSHIKNEGDWSFKAENRKHHDTSTEKCWVCWCFFHSSPYGLPNESKSKKDLTVSGKVANKKQSNTLREKWIYPCEGPSKKCAQEMIPDFFRAGCLLFLDVFLAFHMRHTH